jgi:DNA end-binding protein Ku
MSFGLVSIPVKLVNAVSKKTVSFNQIDKRNGSRIKLRKTNAVDGTDVPDDAIIKGYELSKDRYVLFEEDELAKLEPTASRQIEILEFIELTEIDPIYFDSAYYLTPDKGAAKPYALLARAMEASGKVALAQMVMRSKQYLAAVRAVDGRLVLSTMAYADEVVDPATLDGMDEVAGVTLSDREMAMANQLVESLVSPFEPARFHDTHREQLLELIEAKASGAELPELPAATTHAKVVDLLAALEASVQEAKAARSRHPSTGSEADADAADVGAPASTVKSAKRAAKKAPAKVKKIA